MNIFFLFSLNITFLILCAVALDHRPDRADHRANPFRAHMECGGRAKRRHRFLERRITRDLTAIFREKHRAHERSITRWIRRALLTSCSFVPFVVKTKPSL